MKLRTPLLLLAIVVLLFQGALAEVTCSSNNIITTFTTGDSVPTKSISCSNDGNQSVTISETGQYFSIDESIIGPAPSSKTITITFDGNAPEGMHIGVITLEDSIPVTVLMIVEDEEPSNPSAISFPTSKNINIKQD